MEYKDLFPDVYIGPRKSGKTTNLLIIANAKNVPILVHNQPMKRHLEDYAKRLGLKNVRVITLYELDRGSVGGVIVDEAQLLLEQLLKVRIDSLSITTYNHIELAEITYEH